MTPKLLLLIGLSARSPLTGFKKHQAGTTPNSTLFSGAGVDLKSDLAVCTKDEFSLPTTHQPSSKDCTTVRCSPRFVNNSSGRTGSNNWRTLRDVPDVVVASNEDVPDITENRCWGVVGLVQLTQELRDIEGLAHDLGVDASGARNVESLKLVLRENKNGFAELGVGIKSSDSTLICMSSPEISAGNIRALAGSTTVESSLFLEKPIL